MGDIESTVVKAFVYALRIRLEIGVLDSMALFLQKKVGAVYTSSTGSCPSNPVAAVSVSQDNNASASCFTGSEVPKDTSAEPVVFPKEVPAEKSVTAEDNVP
uniref:Uncharacterized protein n=1 Tax=Thalassionema nitzschioides TaxID=33649 RepID=A0A7S1E0Y2_9STRA|mmetsp:Transcript_3232/g.2691  ORF Transcript_3232/g.2691 Transcript_3232/m.2691 type:complete len:102 (+) Transcript_3232:3-308(+)